MSIFRYTLPSGSTYVVETPAGYTQAQADYVFYSQVAAGSLVGYTAGQTLETPVTRLTKFALSRLDRDTAGVDITTILAIITGTTVSAPIPSLANIPLTNPITAADFAQVGPVTPVGPLTASQTQAVIAQISNLVDQSPDIVTDDGLGEYGFKIPPLEQTGYLKPGTDNSNCNLPHLLSTPSVWTGKNGVYDQNSLLGDRTLQTQVQNEIMQANYSALTASGTIQTAPSQPVSLSTGQVYTNAGLSTLTAATLLTGTAALSGSLNGLVASSFKNAPNIGSLLSNPVENISTLASGAVNSVTQSIANLPGTALATANNLVTGTLNSLTGSAASLVNNAIGSTLGQAGSLVSSLSSSTSGAVGGLLANASQFGAPVTALWAQGSGALSSALGSVTGLASGIAGPAQSLVTGALGDLTNLASTALGSITDRASTLLTSLGGSLDVFGKMSSFSVDFSLFSSDSLVSATKVAAGYSNTVNRQTVDAAMTRILGSSKIPVPIFEYPGPAALGTTLDINFAKNALQSLTGVAGQIQNVA